MALINYTISFDPVKELRFDLPANALVNITNDNIMVRIQLPFIK
jgi:hypothetical protein